MKRLVLIAASTLALTACGSSENAADVTNEMSDAAGSAVSAVEDTTAAAVGAVTAPMVNTADGYVTNAAISDMYEVQSSQLALEKAQSAEVKQFAQKMINDHTATTDQLKSTVASANLNITPPTSLDSRRQGMLDNLKGLSGAEFDKAYLEQQTAAHEEALNLHRGFAEDGDNEALKKLAAEIAPKIENHLEMVRGMKTSA
ncbi:DUF4142 domain-containing protein [Novosphingobium sp. M1R2S20]|uniref:DUF4142 domain-containing protein n=1 Tax=Novosphingobium rhizovicinum TaxID=3228928 RepID=A0ABV3R8I7_9SPHN